MKPWEVLKAVDEGKTVQFQEVSGGWTTCTSPRTWSFGSMEKYNWRIKPEPRVIYVAEQKNGLFFAYTSEATAKRCNFENRVGNIHKFVEVLED